MFPKSQPQYQNLLDIEQRPTGRPYSVSSQPGLDHLVSVTQSGNISVSEIVLACGTGMKELYGWIKDTLNKNFSRKDGVVTLVDLSRKPIVSIEFIDAFISSVKLPALDRSSNEGTYFTVSIQPERVRLRKTGGTLDPKDLLKYGPPLPGAWSEGHFKLSIDGLEKECAAVTKIESFTIKQVLALSFAGEEKTPQTQPGKLDESDLSLTIPGSSGDVFRDWFQSSVMAGTNPGVGQKKGSLEYFTPKSTTPLRFVFNDIGIKSISMNKDVSLHLPVTVELYYDSIVLDKY